VFGVRYLPNTEHAIVRRIVLPLLRPTVIAVAAFTITLC